MRCGERSGGPASTGAVSGAAPRSALTLALALVVLASGAAGAEPRLHLVHQQRYAMGTMFDILAYHPSRPDAERAMTRALDEIVRLDQVLSHFKTDSDLARLLRDGRGTFVAVESSLYEVIRESIAFSRRSRGTFDITIGPLLDAWRTAHDQNRRPSSAEIDSAARCIGYAKIELDGHNRIKLHSDCMRIDLGAIGKGYAVDRAIAILKAAAIGSALVNAGGSSIAAIGAPPGERGWPVRLPATVSGHRTLLLRDGSISTSQQTRTAVAFDGDAFGEIMDPHALAPAPDSMAVSVVAPSATVSDALGTTLVLLSVADGKNLLSEFPDVSAIWATPAGRLEAAHRESQLVLASVH